MALPAIKFGSSTQPSTGLSEQLAALKTCSYALKTLLLQGLSAPDPAAWLAHWHDEERWETFADLFKGFRRTLHSLPEEVKQQASEQKAHEQLAKSFPGKRDQLAAIRDAQEAAFKILHDALPHPVRSEDLKAVDAECAASFNGSQLWFVIGVNSLLVLAEARQQGTTPIADELLDGILAVTFDSAREALHSAKEGAQLRFLPEDTVHLTFHAAITPTSDGQGFLGSCSELDAMTCGETEDEVGDLMVDLLAGFLVGEAARRTLRAVLATQLKMSGEAIPNQLRLRVYVSSPSGPYTQFIAINLGT
jgi:hypothetical protein